MPSGPGRAGGVAGAPLKGYGSSTALPQTVFQGHRSLCTAPASPGMLARWARRGEASNSVSACERCSGPDSTILPQILQLCFASCIGPASAAGNSALPLSGPVFAGAALLGVGTVAAVAAVGYEIPYRFRVVSPGFTRSCAFPWTSALVACRPAPRALVFCGPNAPLRLQSRGGGALAGRGL